MLVCYCADAVVGVDDPVLRKVDVYAVTADVLRYEWIRCVGNKIGSALIFSQSFGAYFHVHESYSSATSSSLSI